jgi:DNA-binding transcriptional LysR family regulator
MTALRLSDRIGYRVKLHDLHVLMTVAEAGSMGKAAQRLNTTQPAVSRSVAALENALGVRLLDRNRQGVQPTEHGRAFLACGLAVFDDLRQGAKSIEFLSDPRSGEITVGGNEAFIAGPLAAVFDHLRDRYPGVAIHAKNLPTPTEQFHALRERRVDLVFGRIPSSVENDIKAELWFQNRLYVRAGLRNPWANTRRRKIDLAELINEPWALPPRESLIGMLAVQAFRASGVEFPRRGVATGPIHLLDALLAKGPYLAIVSDTILQFSPNLPRLKVLPVDLPVPSWPVGIMTLKNRSISPAAKLFIDCAREVVKPIAADQTRSSRRNRASIRNSR